MGWLRKLMYGEPAKQKVGGWTQTELPKVTQWSDTSEGKAYKEEQKNAPPWNVGEPVISLVKSLISGEGWYFFVDHNQYGPSKRYEFLNWNHDIALSVTQLFGYPGDNFFVNANWMNKEEKEYVSAAFVKYKREYAESLKQKERDKFMVLVPSQPGVSP